MDSDGYKAMCEEHILPILVEKMGFEPKIKLSIVPEALFNHAFRKKYPEQNPELCCGLVVNKQSIFVKEDPRTIVYGFIHELLHIYYPRRDGETPMRYEMRIRFLSIAVFYGIMIYVLGKEKAQEFFGTIKDFKLTIPDYLKKNSHAFLTRIRQSRRTNWVISTLTLSFGSPKRLSETISVSLGHIKKRKTIQNVYPFSRPFL